VADVSDSFMEEFDLPELPRGLPRRLEEALSRRIEALLYRLERGTTRRYLPPLEVRLARDTQRAVLAAIELDLKDADVYYARFRELMMELDYDRCEVGYKRQDP
jgi:hypothetical protein